MRAIARLSCVVRHFSSGPAKSTTQAAKADPMKNVTGLTSSCVKVNEQKQVPGTGAQGYTPAEYFGYNRMSYFEAEVEMEKFRVPQPVAPRK